MKLDNSLKQNEPKYNRVIHCIKFIVFTYLVTGEVYRVLKIKVFGFVVLYLVSCRHNSVELVYIYKQFTKRTLDRPTYAGLKSKANYLLSSLPRLAP